MKRFKKCKDWVKDVKTNMDYLAITTNHKKLTYIKSQAGPQLPNFVENELRARWENMQADTDLGIDAVFAHTSKDQPPRSS